MKVIVSNTAEELGKRAADIAAEYLNDLIKNNGEARIVVSTGASQFETFNALIASNIN